MKICLGFEIKNFRKLYVHIQMLALVFMQLIFRDG